MVLQPAIEGMLGFKPDAMNNTLRLSPRFPADWNSVNITNIKAGDHTINLKIERKNSIITYSFNHNGNSKLKIIFAPQLPNGTVINSIEISDESESKNLKPQEALQFHILKTTILKYKISGGIKVLPISHNPNPDDISTGMRIISDELKDNYYNVVVEGISGTVEELKIYYPGTKKMEVKNATVSAHNKDIYTLKVKFDSSTEQYKSKIIKIRY
jgi:hypothetical protein